MEAIIAQKFQVLEFELNERQRRLWAASEAICLGRGCVTGATGMSRTTITQGGKELQKGKPLAQNRVRQEGANIISSRSGKQPFF